jgi:hypothetical protein
MHDGDGDIRFALHNKRLIGIRYQGRDRIAEPHDYGVQKGMERLLVYQLIGPTRPGQSAAGWRLLEVSKIESLVVLDETFRGSRGSSHQDHHAWDVVYARVG